MGNRQVKSILSWVLTATMLCVLLLAQPMNLYAAATSEYEQLAAGTEEAAVAVLREKMKEREATITVSIDLEDAQQAEGLAERLYAAAIAHTGVPTEGDYLQWHCGEWKANITITTVNGQTSAEITYTISYYTTKAQEEELDRKIQSVLDDLDLYDATEYEKIRGIYDYICTHITYDYEHLEDWNYTLMFTAYAAMVNETAVCQGYALLFYRMALALGLDARFVGGIAGGPHAWNIVRIGSIYYNLDATYDAALVEVNKPYEYFLRCEDNFGEHLRWSEYRTDEFYQMHPMCEADYVDETAAADQCGENLTWELDNRGVLTISGTGDMYDYTSSEQAPWYVSRKRVRMVVLEEGVTGIGSFAFDGCDKLTVVYLPQSLTAVSASAFVGCSGLWHIMYAGTQAQWDAVSVDAESLQNIVRHNDCTGNENLDTEDRVCHICIANCTHQWNVETLMQEASCETDGEALYKCAACGLTEVKIVPAMGHQWNEASCSDPKTCETCHITEGEALGHSYDSEIVAPTCTAEGYTSHTCENCGDSYTDTPTAVAEHTFGQWETVREATAKDPGEKVRVCTACGEEEREQIPVTETKPTTTQPDVIEEENGDDPAVWIVVTAALGIVVVAGVIVLLCKKRK